MSEERQPDEETRVEIDGYEVVTYSYGTGDEVVFLLNGLLVVAHRLSVSRNVAQGDTHMSTDEGRCPPDSHGV